MAALSLLDSRGSTGVGRDCQGESSQFVVNGSGWNGVDCQKGGGVNVTQGVDTLMCRRMMKYDIKMYYRSVFIRQNWVHAWVVEVGA